MVNWMTPVIQKHIDAGDSVLDICCGVGNVMNGIKCRVVVGLDIYLPYLEVAKSYCLPFRVDVSRIDDFVVSKSFDVVVCLDCVEHLEEKDAYKLIEVMEKVA